MNEKIFILVAMVLVFCFLLHRNRRFLKSEAEEKVYKWRLVTHSMVGTYRYKHSWLLPTWLK
jgi:hypothetical protein